MGLVRVDLPEDALPWRGTLDEPLLRQRAQYIAGIEYIARTFGALEPLAWEHDALTLIFGGVSTAALPLHTYRASKELWSRVRTELDLPVRIAAHLGYVRAAEGAGTLSGDALEECRRLAAEAPRGHVALTEELALSLREPEKREIAALGAGAGIDRIVYVYPRISPASTSAAPGVTFDDAQPHWRRLRDYATGPDVRLVRYVGFPLQKKQPPALDIRDIFVASEVELHRRADARARPLDDLHGELAQLPWSGHAVIPADGGGAQPFRELYARARSLIVLGDPGSGKTTLLRWLAITAASGSFTLGVELGAPERLLPVPVSVGRLAEVRRGLGIEGVSVPAALARYFHDRSVAEDEASFRGQLVGELERGRCLVLLDGLDEVKSEERRALHQWIESFAAEYPDNRFIASSRVVGYTGLSLPGEAVEAVLRPFTDAQVERYVRGFHRAYVRWETGAEPSGTIDADRLLEAIRASPRLSGLAKNPFMLSALALIHRAEGRLPRHRVQAYEIFARALCETWSEARRIVAGEAISPTIAYEEEALPILGELALAMHAQYPTGVAPEEFVLRELAEALSDQKQVAGVEAKRAAREFLKRAGEDVQILLERGAGAWGFLHLTFQEFFVAAGLHASERFDELARQHLFDPRWEEVLRLGVGYLALIQKRPKAAQKFVTDVLEHQEPGARSWVTRLLRKQVPLAALLAAEAGDALPAALQERVARELADWLKIAPESVAGPILQDLALTDFATRAAAACRPLLMDQHARVRVHGAAALGALRSTEAAGDLIAAFADDREDVRRAAVRAIKSIRPRAALGAITAKLTDPKPAVRASAVEVLSHLSPDFPAALPSALQDTDAQVRATAVYALKDHDWQIALPLLRDAAMNDSPSVQLAAAICLFHLKAKEELEVLINSDNDAVSTLASSFLTQVDPGSAARLTAHKNAFVRQPAADWIFEHSPIDQRLAALHSSDAHMRTAGALSLHQEGDPIEPLLEALRDASPGVRFAAARTLARHRRREALAPLLEVLEDKADWRLGVAADALRTLGAEDAAEPLLSVAERESAAELAIYKALGALASSEHVERLERLLERHEQPSDAFEAILEALWAIADRDARRAPVTAP
ncbi:NACHT domain-containing protein [Sorangium sp. So ce341]|uniref:NACHT domain-containing protein n=1 Tax=Sorangium sp. So ce341 TaxID=3133302 RepID=UPI003F60C4DA